MEKAQADALIQEHTMDFVGATNGSMIICHHTNTPCSPMCPFYIEQYAGSAICADVENSVILVLNNSLSHPWPGPIMPYEHQAFMTPKKELKAGAVTGKGQLDSVVDAICRRVFKRSAYDVGYAVQKVFVD